LEKRGALGETVVPQKLELRSTGEWETTTVVGRAPGELARPSDGGPSSLDPDERPVGRAVTTMDRMSRMKTPHRRLGLDGWERLRGRPGGRETRSPDLDRDERARTHDAELAQTLAPGGSPGSVATP
jgi:hypothetical protein